MLVGPACYSPAPARQISVNGILNPFQNRKIIARQAKRNTPQSSATIFDPDDSTGDRLYTMDPLTDQTYLVLDIRPVGTVLFSDGEPIPPTNTVNGGFRYTFATARVTWIEAGGAVQCVDVDIGAGTVFTVPPTNIVDVDLLIPDPQGIDQIPVPEGFDRDQRFATTVSCKATCVRSPTPTQPTTQSCVYVQGDEDFGAVGQQIPIPRGADSVQIFSAPAVGHGLPVDEPENTIASFGVEPVPLAPGAAIPPPFDTWPTQQVGFSEDAQTRQTQRVQIPHDFNVLRIRTGVAASDNRRNVCAVFNIAL